MQKRPDLGRQNALTLLAKSIGSTSLSLRSRRPAGPSDGRPKSARQARPPVAWEVVVALVDPAGGPLGKTERVGCMAHTKGEARSKIRKLINSHYNARLIRLPAGMSPVRCENPGFCIKFDGVPAAPAV